MSTCAVEGGGHCGTNSCSYPHARPYARTYLLAHACTQADEAEEHIRKAEKEADKLREQLEEFEPTAATASDDPSQVGVENGDERDGGNGDGDGNGAEDGGGDGEGGAGRHRIRRSSSSDASPRTLPTPSQVRTYRHVLLSRTHPLLSLIHI